MLIPLFLAAGCAEDRSSGLLAEDFRFFTGMPCAGTMIVEDDELRQPVYSAIWFWLQRGRDPTAGTGEFRVSLDHDGELADDQVGLTVVYGQGGSWNCDVIVRTPDQEVMTHELGHVLGIDHHPTGIMRL